MRGTDRPTSPARSSRCCATPRARGAWARRDARALPNDGRGLTSPSAQSALTRTRSRAVASGALELAERLDEPAGDRREIAPQPVERPDPALLGLDQSRLAQPHHVVRDRWLRE